VVVVVVVVVAVAEEEEEIFSKKNDDGWRRSWAGLSLSHSRALQYRGAYSYGILILVMISFVARIVGVRYDMN
jgi:hypothetical protein